MIIAGIDPGVTGAIFVLGADVSSAIDVPTIKQKVAGKKSPRVVPDYHRWMEVWAKALEKADHVFFEHVTGGNKGTGQSQGGMFKFGHVTGFALGIVVASGKPYTYITPQRWKKHTGIPAGSSKDDSRRRASQLLPQYAELWPLVKHGGRAEAALIAYTGMARLHSEFQGGQVASADSGGGRSRAA